MTELIADVDADLAEIDYDDIPAEVEAGDEIIRADYSANHDAWTVSERGTVDRVMDSITMAVYLEDGGQLGAVDDDEERVYKVA